MDGGLCFNDDLEVSRRALGDEEDDIFSACADAGLKKLKSVLEGALALALALRLGIVRWSTEGHNRQRRLFPIEYRYPQQLNLNYGRMGELHALFVWITCIPKLRRDEVDHTRTGELNL